MMARSQENTLSGVASNAQVTLLCMLRTWSFGKVTRCKLAYRHSIECPWNIDHESGPGVSLSFVLSDLCMLSRAQQYIEESAANLKASCFPSESSSSPTALINSIGTICRYSTGIREIHIEKDSGLSVGG